MKKFYFIVASLVAMFLTVRAEAQITVGAGYNLGTLTQRFNGESDSEGLGGFYLEATYDWDFMNGGWGIIGLQPGVRFSYMGDSEKEEGAGLKTVASFNETYLDIPVNVRYSYYLGPVKLSAFAGPVFSVGLSSVRKSRVTGNLAGQEVDYTIKYHQYSGKTVTEGTDAPSASPAMDYARFDLKLGVGFGANFMERFNVKLGYNFGLLNRYTGEQRDKMKLHTGVFYVGLGYSF